MIKEVPDPTLMCEGCVFDGKKAYADYINKKDKQ